MKKLILSAMLLVALTFGMTSCNNTEKKTMTEQGKHNHIDGDNHETVYKCPMDCEKGNSGVMAFTLVGIAGLIIGGLIVKAVIRTR